jgi:hypothetical protein
MIPDDSRMAGVLRPTNPRPHRRLALVTAAFALAATLGACSEDLDSGGACATLCPGTQIESREVALPAIVDEAVVPGLIETGAEILLPLIDRRDTVQTRVVVRFDTLLTKYQVGTSDSLADIDSVADASVLLSVDRARSTIQDSVVVEAYDVDDGSEDTTTAGIESRLVPGRLLGTERLAPGDIDDTIAVPLNNSYLLAKLKQPNEAQRRVRVALKVTSPRSVVLRIVATQGGATDGPILRYKQNGTTTLLSMIARSDAPADERVADLLADFATLPVRPPVRAGDVFAVGGLPPRRTFLRFAIPDSIDEAAAVLQAELRLVQVPDPLRALRDSVRIDTTTTGLRERVDTVVVLPLIGIGGETVVADPIRASQLARRSVGLDGLTIRALRVAPNDSGVKAIDVASMLRRWRFLVGSEPRYLVLTAESEGTQAASAYFWSSAVSDPTLRPTLYIRYVPRVGYGLP